MDQSQKFKSVLGERGYSVTKPRMNVFKALLATDEPITTTELVDRLASADKVTIYRTVQLFEELAIVHRVYVGWKYKIELSDQFVAHHHHLSCLNCGKIIDIQDEQHIDEFIQAMAARYDFSPRRHQFEIDGYCAVCAAAK